MAPHRILQALAAELVATEKPSKRRGVTHEENSFLLSPA